MLYIDLHTTKAGLMMIKPINKNFESYAKKEIEKAKFSCTVQSMIGHPSNEHYRQMLDRNNLVNCSIDIDDVKNSKVIFGTYLSSRSEGVEHSKDSKICEQ